ncbi:hypothetical protein H6F61_09380 [Cyanobacteria bacterium FACHB-472]|nr:hypothetical protein [Cyanobacteria bacterium FACHB-472]
MFLFLKCHCLGLGIGDWGLGLGTGDWGLGARDWGLGKILLQFPILQFPIPNSPIPNSQSQETVIFFSPSVLETNLG